MYGFRYDSICSSRQVLVLRYQLRLMHVEEVKKEERQLT
jgi:hypothetical protein